MIIKAKSAAPTPLELGRLVEDEHLLQAQMEWNRIESNCRRVSHVDINLHCLCCMLGARSRQGCCHEGVPAELPSAVFTAARSSRYSCSTFAMSFTGHHATLDQVH